MNWPPKVGPKNPTFGGLLMAKYSYELKKEIVEEYLSGKTSYRDLAMKYQIENLFLDYGSTITNILAMKV